MIEVLFSNTNYLAAKKMLDATALRHEAIASNLANVETPRYKRVDLAPNFAADLQRALATKDRAELARLQPRLAADARAIAQRRDGNNVDLENELLQMQQNSLAHALESQLVTGALLKLRLAITGRPV